MRLLTLVIGLAILLWIIYAYQRSNNVINADGDKTVKQQAVEDVKKAKEAAGALQKSIQDQANLIQKANEN